MAPIKQFSFFAWNVDQARREEEHPETKWDVRSGKVKELIATCDADVMALIELRDLVTSTESARAFLSDPRHLKYDIVSRRYCHYSQTFQMALLFKPEKFFCGDVRVHTLGDNPENSKIAMFVDLQSKETHKWITIGVTHFDLEEDVKWKSFKTLKPLLENQLYPCMIYGDYNCFDDREGTQQRQYILDTCDDLVHPLHHDGDFDLLSGTFVGFPHDTFKQRFDKMSRLDHVFAPKVHGLRSSGRAISPSLDKYRLDNKDYATYTYPSDHLAVFLSIVLPADSVV